MNVKNRSAVVASLIIAEMTKGENQGSFSLDVIGDRQPLTTRERYDTVQVVFDTTAIKVGLSVNVVEDAAHSHGRCHSVTTYQWETI